ncbi:cytochrome P450 4c21-like [Ochlerotatus camptorhynchus]|uniref:cytochrome P450 4c21-like n=1 Tax=Ochlerotatus camptorhynchus TaxID=644619 RepID=UPI0031D7CD32
MDHPNAHCIPLFGHQRSSRMEITLLLLWIVVGLAVVAYLAHKWKYRSIRVIPGAKPDYLLLGNIPLLWKKKNVYKNIFRTEYRMSKIWLGPVPVINVQHPELVQKVLTECLDKPFPYDFMELKFGLLSQRRSSVWREHRKTLSPLFNLKILNSFIPVFERATNDIMERLEKVSDRRDIDMFKYTSHCIAQMVYGTMVNIEHDSEEVQHIIYELIANLEIILHSIAKRIMNGVYALKILYQMSAIYREEWRARAICYDTVNYAIMIMRMNILNKPSAPDAADTNDQSKSKAFVERLLTIQHKGRSFTDEEIINHAYTMLVAGYETSALQLTNICMMLAMHPEIQEKIVHEIKAVFPTPDSAVTPETLKDLPYLDMTINETMRLYPVATLIARQSSSSLELDGVNIPKGTCFIVNIGEVHRRKDVWGADPLEFNPENFLPERVANRHPYAFIPLSAGPRNCIGYRYAMISLKIFLIRLLQQYRLSTKLTRKDLKFKFQVTLKLKIPYTVQIEKRNLYEERAGAGLNI